MDLICKLEYKITQDSNCEINSFYNIVYHGYKKAKNILESSFFLYISFNNNSGYNSVDETLEKAIPYRMLY